MTPFSGGGLHSDLRRTARRIGLQTAALLVVCLVAVGVVVFLVVVGAQDRQLGQTLSAATATAGFGNDRDHGTPQDLNEPRGGIQNAVIDRNGLRTSTDVPDGLPDLQIMHQVAATHTSDRRTVHLDSGAFELLTVQRGDDTVQVIASRFELHQERERILGALGIAGGAGLVLASLAAAVLAQRAVRPMAQALDMQRRFVADAGHELRTPLTLLSTRSQLLARRARDATAPPEQRDQMIIRDANGIVADTSALTLILEELLMAADVRTPVPQEPVDLALLVAAAVDSAQAAAEDAGVRLGVNIDGNQQLVVTGAPGALGRSVVALVDNAVEHAASDVLVRVVRDRRQVIIEVTDDGPGISSAVLPRVFDRFFSSDTGESVGDRRRHFGLGLALVSEIAVRHHGTVTATNRPTGADGSTGSTGAILTLTLPFEANTRYRL